MMFLWLFFKTQHALGMVFSDVFPKGFSIGLEKHQKKKHIQTDTK